MLPVNAGSVKDQISQKFLGIEKLPMARTVINLGIIFNQEISSKSDK